MLIVQLDVAVLVFVSLYPRWISGCLLFDFEESVDVLFEQSVVALFVVVNLKAIS